MSVGSQEVCDLAQCVSRLVHQGMPLSSGLAALKRDLPAGRLRRTLDAVLARLELGQPLETAFAQGARVPGALHGLLLAGLRAGAIDAVLDEFLRHERRLAEWRRRLALTLVYPAILLVALAAVVTFVCAAIVPPIYGKPAEDLGTLLGLIHSPTQGLATRLLLGISVVLREHFLLLANALGCALLVGWLWVRHTGVAAIPLVGPIVRHAQRGEFFRLLSLLVRHEVPLAPAMRLLAQDVRDRRFRSAVLSAAGQLEAGAPPASALVRLVSREASELVTWMQDHRSFAEGLEMLAAMADGEAQTRFEMVRTLLPAAVFLCVIVTTLVLLAGLYGPMLGTIDHLGALS